MALPKAEKLAEKPAAAVDVDAGSGSQQIRSLLATLLDAVRDLEDSAEKEVISIKATAVATTAAPQTTATTATTATATTVAATTVAAATATATGAETETETEIATTTGGATAETTKSSATVETIESATETATTSAKAAAEAEATTTLATAETTNATEATLTTITTSTPTVAAETVAATTTATAATAAREETATETAATEAAATSATRSAFTGATATPTAATEATTTTTTATPTTTTTTTTATAATAAREEIATAEKDAGVHDADRRLEGSNDDRLSEEDREWADAALALPVVEALLHDREVMTESLGNYHASLNSVLAELANVRAKAQHVKAARSSLPLLQSCLARETAAREALLRENAHLAARNKKLIAIAQEALEAEGDVQRDAFIDSLASENCALWQLVRISQNASRAAATAAAVGPLVLPSPVRRKRSTSSCGSPGIATETPPPSVPSTVKEANEDSLPGESQKRELCDDETEECSLRRKAIPEEEKDDVGEDKYADDMSEESAIFLGEDCEEENATFNALG